MAKTRYMVNPKIKISGKEEVYSTQHEAMASIQVYNSASEK